MSHHPSSMHTGYIPSTLSKQYTAFQTVCSLLHMVTVTLSRSHYYSSAVTVTVTVVAWRIPGQVSPDSEIHFHCLANFCGCRPIGAPGVPAVMGRCENGWPELIEAFTRFCPTPAVITFWPANHRTDVTRQDGIHVYECSCSRSRPPCSAHAHAHAHANLFKYALW